MNVLGARGLLRKADRQQLDKSTNQVENSDDASRIRNKMPWARVGLLYAEFSLLDEALSVFSQYGSAFGCVRGHGTRSTNVKS